ncbi:MAG: hypothetical protein U1F36_17450 [Planctomycetota bacterium]
MLRHAFALRFSATAVAWLTFALLAVTVVAVAFVPAQFRWLDYHALPPIAVLVALVAYAAVAFVTAGSRTRWPVHATLVGLLLCAHLSVLVQPLGDAGTWRDWVHGDRLGASELLANAVYRLVYRASGAAGLDYVAPVTGAVFGWVFLRVSERLVGVDGPCAAERRLWCAAALAFGGWQVMCVRGYVENTLFCLPFLMLGLAAAARATGSATDRRSLAAAAAWLTLAAMFHGVASSMLPILPFVVVWNRMRHGPVAGIVRPLALAIGIVATTIAVVLALLKVVGFEIVAGHVSGGGDGRHFVPLHIDGSPFHYDFAMFDPAHVADVGNIFLFTSPLTLPCLSLLSSRRWRTAVLAALLRRPALGVAGLGAASFTAVYYFDLRFPYDTDLMVVMSSPLCLFLLQAVVRVPRRLRATAAGLVLIGGAMTWTLIASLLTTPPTAGATTATLLLNGRAGAVTLRPGEQLLLQLIPPTSGRPPFRFSIYGFLGDPSADAAARTHHSGLLFAPPGDPEADAARAFLLMGPDALGVSGQRSPEIREPWVSQRLGDTGNLKLVVLQALVRDADGVATESTALWVVAR